MTPEKAGLVLSEFNQQTGSEEASVLYNLAEELNVKVIVEIGVAEGGSLKLWSNLIVNDGIVIGIDAHDYRAWKMASPVFFIKGDTKSADTLDSCMAILSGRKIDFLRIDGGHDYESVKNDYEKYGPLVKVGGIIAFHDYLSSSDVKRFVNGLWLDGIKYCGDTAYVLNRGCKSCARTSSAGMSS